MTGATDPEAYIVSADRAELRTHLATGRQALQAAISYLELVTEQATAGRLCTALAAALHAFSEASRLADGTTVGSPCPAG